MPLVASSSKPAFKSNLKELLASGRALKEALGAAYSNQRRARAKGK